MEDKEFIRPQEEFAPPREEFVPPKPEFSPPRDEFSPPQEEERTDGREYEQTTQPAEKKEKKRRINPLMVTAAAVTAAVVTVSGLSMHWDRVRQWCRLDEPHYAYLEELTDAMRERDIAAMKELAADERLRTLLEKDVIPFYEEVGIKDRVATVIEDQYGGLISAPILQRGNRVTDDLWTAQEDEKEWGLYLSYDPNTAQYQTVAIDLWENYDLNDPEDISDAYYLHCSWNEQGEMDMWEIWDDVYHNVPNESDSYYPYVGATWEIYHIAWNRQHREIPQVTVMEGTCSYGWETSETGETNLRTWLENGTVTTYEYVGGYMDSEWALVSAVTVRDGYAYGDGISEPLYHFY